MHIKRNLTIAVLAALIGVPALSATNANADNTIRYRQNPVNKNEWDPAYNYGKGAATEAGTGDPAPTTNKAAAEAYNQEQSGGNSLSTNNQSDNSTQYSTNHNSLPQTNEVDHQSSVLAASIILGSVGIGAAAIDKKHNQID